MGSIRRMRSRPALTTAFVTAILAVALLAVPISYNRTVGHDVLLTVSGPSMDDAAAGRVAGEVKSALDAENVTVTAVPAEPGLKTIRLGTDPTAPNTPPSQDIAFSSPARKTYTFRARVGSNSRANVEAAAAALARILAERGMDAEFGVSVVRQEVSGNVYAMALDKVLEIRVDGEGKTPEELADEIRLRLEDAGVPNPEVTVSDDGDMMKICVRACGEDRPCDEMPEFDVSIGGLDLDSPNARKIEVRRTPDMTDADVIAEVERQLREQGVDAEVTIVDGRIEIEIND